MHLHYIYSGDASELSNVYDVGIEVKTLPGDSSLRRKLTKCNNFNVTTIGSGLPKKDKNMLSVQSVKSERGLRDLIGRNLRKERFIPERSRPSTSSTRSFRTLTTLGWRTTCVT